MTKRLRALVAKPGLDGHDRGAKVIAQALKDAGLEVIYTGLHQTPEMIVNSAIQEDVDVICLSILSGAHNRVVSDLMECLKKKDASDIPVIAGGVIPDEDIEPLKKVGVKGVFTPGTPLAEVTAFVTKVASARG